MPCVICGGEEKSEVIFLDLRVEGRLMIIEDVPSVICQQCGGKTFSPEITRKIQEIAEAQPKTIRVINVPVVSCQP